MKYIREKQIKQEKWERVAVTVEDETRLDCGMETSHRKVLLALDDVDDGWMGEQKVVGVTIYIGIKRLYCTWLRRSS